MVHGAFYARPIKQSFTLHDRSVLSKAFSEKRGIYIVIPVRIDLDVKRLFMWAALKLTEPMALWAQLLHGVRNCG
jgi:hypothetical protein